jgi:hypothetical protein
MPRQPYHRVSPNTPASGLVMGTYMRGKRSGLELLIGQCIMSWPPVETAMAMILAHLIGAKDAAAMAVFHHLRRSASQREAVMEAAQIVLNPTELELLTALLNVHKSIEGERNALAHGYFGVAEDLPDAVLWLSTNDYVALKGAISMRGAISSLHPEWKGAMTILVSLTRKGRRTYMVDPRLEVGLFRHLGSVTRHGTTSCAALVKARSASRQRTPIA